MTQEEIAAKRDNDQVRELHDVLYHIYNDKKATFSKLLRHNTFNKDYEVNSKESLLKKLFSTNKKSLTISEQTAHLGLLFLNCFPSLRNGEGLRYNESVYLNNKRFQKFKEKHDLNNLWNGENYNLLILLFGEEMAKYVKLAYENVGNLMYQTGYNRRSFRRPNNKDFAHCLQINLMISLINLETVHPFSLKESIQYDVPAYYSRMDLVWAAAIDNGNEEIFNTCADILQGKAEIGQVSRSIIKALLLSNQPKAWELVGNLLLSAQRQEGLRQTILEALDETSVGAFTYILKLVNAENLSRFSSVVRSLDVWAGFAWDAEKQSTVKRFFQLAEKYVSQPELLEKEINNKDNAEVYMALWGQGVHDVDKCYPYLKQLFAQGTLEKKNLALYFVNEANIKEWNKEFAYLALAENHLQMNYWAVKLFNKTHRVAEDKALFEKIENIFLTFKEKQITFSGKVFAWSNFVFTKSSVASLMIDLSDMEIVSERDRILNYYDDLPVENREQIGRTILKGFTGYGNDKITKKPTDFQRNFALKILKDRSSYIREWAMRTLKNAEIGQDEILLFETMLTRKSAEFRTFVLDMVQKRSTNEIFESAERLVNAKSMEQRLAGLDLLNHLYKKDAQTEQVKAIATAYAERTKIGKKEQILLDNLLKEKAIEYNADNGFGLYNPKNTTEVHIPEKPTSGEFYTRNFKSKYPYGLSIPIAKIEAKLQDLYDLFIANKDYEYEIEYWDNSKRKVLLGNTFTHIKRRKLEEKITAREEFENYPLYEIWEEWYLQSKLTSFDLFAIYFLELFSKEEVKTYPKTTKNLAIIDYEIKAKNPVQDKYGYLENPLFKIIQALKRVYPYQEKSAFIFGGMNFIFTQLDTNEINISKLVNKWNNTYSSILEMSVIRKYRQLNYQLNENEKTNDEDFVNYWNIISYEHHIIPQKAKKKYIPSIASFLRAYTLQLCTQDELMQRLMISDAIELFTFKGKNKNNWKVKHQQELLKKYPFATEMIDKCRERILEIELRRGDSSTSVTLLAQKIGVLYGTDYLIQILNGLGKDTLNRGYIYSYGSNEYSKKEILSTLLKRCFPTEKDTQEEFNQKIKTAKFTEKRLVEVGLYAQQWLPFIENYLNWKGLSSAVWWLHAHTNAYHSAETETEIARYSAIDIKSFADGAVDYDWFQSAYKTVGKARWKILYDAAKYISDGIGHNRAKLYADVMTGITKIREVSKRIKDKRNQDYVRVFGLVPLSKKTPEKDVLNRYNTLLQFKKESKQFGSQRQASEALAVRIAMENLARTAGYPDPIRLTWAMETEEAKAIMKKAETLSFDDVTIQLKVDELGKSEIITERKGKALKNIPAKLRKDKNVLELKSLHKKLKDQYSRSRKSLEEAMVRGDVFENKEITALMEHPVIAPMLQNLVLISENGIGFYAEEKLKNTEGETVALGEEIRIAHCSDLYQKKQWTSYQTYCFDHKIVQPFKQIFRELYVPTPDELQEKTISRRYAGHQVQPKKTVALLKSRMWTVDYEEGLQKVFHKEGFIAKMYAMADWFSPADVESPTLETVEFLDRKTYKSIPFADINPLIFSEVMRDIDLVVSVAHVGGVDPEASHSSVEMRSAIIRETARLFKLNNVEIKGHHAHIKGERGEYSVHLGSGVTHLVPGKYLSILPVHSQHRGRLFLPFVDEDPKSAEIMSKILLLAKDKEIKDPTILEQMR